MAKRYLIVRPDAVGDVVLSLPMAESIKAAYPKATVTYWVQKPMQGFLADHPLIDTILYAPRLPNTSWTWSQLQKTVKDLKKHQFTVAILPYLDLFYALACFLAKIPVRVGDKNHVIPSLFLNKATRLDYRNIRRHVVEHNLHLLSPLLPPKSLKTDLNLYSNPENEAQLQDHLAKQNYQNEALIVVQPCTGGSDYAWPEGNYIALIDKIHQQTGHRVILIGAGPEEEAIIAQIKTKTAITPYTLTGFGTFGLLKALLKKSDLIVGSNTGPLHIAAAMKTPVVSLFPSKFIKPTLWAPWNVPQEIVTHQDRCHEICQHQNCRPECVYYIAINDVFDAIRRCLSTPSINPNSQNKIARLAAFQKSIAVLIHIQKEDSIYLIDAIVQKLKADGIPCKLITNSRWLDRKIEREIKSGAPLYKGKKGLKPLAKYCAKENIAFVHFIDSSPVFKWQLIRNLAALSMSIPPELVNDAPQKLVDPKTTASKFYFDLK